jgi:fructose/tagatose bisphosphate aldolase
MSKIFGNMADKLKAVQELRNLGIDNEQALDIVFESVQENDRMQFFQEVFKVAFSFGQLHQYCKQDENYKTTDMEAIRECVKECTKLINH